MKPIKAPTVRLNLLYLFIYLCSFSLLAISGDENWHARFSSTNAGGEVQAIVARNGELFAAGKFTMADGFDAAHIAKWDGVNWTSLNSGLYADQRISLMATNNDGVFVYSSIGNIRKWNGTAWSFLANQPEPWGEPTCLWGAGSDLYASGLFSSSSSFAGVTLLRWNGTAWSELAGTNATIMTVISKGTDVYAGGSFRRISLPSGFGLVAVTNIARWNGSSWSALGAGVNGTVRCLAVSGNDLYVGGDFTIAGSVSANRVAKWNGTAWSALGSGVNGRVTALRVNGSYLYVGGEFSTAGGVSSSKLARWNGSSWSAVNIPLQGNSVKALASMGTNIYVGGRIDVLNNQSVGNIVSYNGTTWQKLKTGVSFGMVNVLRMIGSDIYAGGDWRSLAGSSSIALAKFDGANWTTVGSSLSNSLSEPIVHDIQSRNNEVFVGGLFDRAGGTSATNIAKWNGSTWQAFGSGLGSVGSSEPSLYGPDIRPVFTLTHRGSELFAGGTFLNSFHHLMKWNGSAWSQVGSPSPDSTVSCLFNAPGDNVYVGGWFYNSPLTSSPYFVRWNGSSWLGVGSLKLNGAVYAMALVGNHLYVGGEFTKIGTGTFNRIARWDGVSWSALGSGLNNEVQSILPVGNDLYVGGYFTTAGGVTVNRIAKWNGTNWSALGSGIGGSGSVVNALAVKGNDLLVGGSFTSAGGQPCQHLAIWRMQSPSLQIRSDQDSFTLSWPAELTPFILQSASDLAVEDWSDNLSSPQLLENVYQLTIDKSENTRFFRLRKN